MLSVVRLCGSERQPGGRTDGRWTDSKGKRTGRRDKTDLVWGVKSYSLVEVTVGILTWSSRGKSLLHT